VRTLAGKNAILIGTKRVGAVVAQRLAAEGINQAIVYRNSRSEAESLAAEVGSVVERTVVVQANASIEEDVQRATTEAAEALGGIDFLVNMASDFQRVPFDLLNAEAWDRSMAAAKGAYLLSVHAARHMSQNDGPTRGHIINFGDWAAGETVYSGYLPYMTAKAAIHFMTRAFATELAGRGILVNAIAPGPTMRPPDIALKDWEEAVIRQTPLQRESSAEEIAAIVAMLLKAESTTGEVIRVDAGRHLVGPGIAASGTLSPS
jgi:NAD(P)-dependent dehydrogenase (short-subunit alcohol dehydrogenase family)